jgi:uncharacterized protein YkwD
MTSHLRRAGAVAILAAALFGGTMAAAAPASAATSTDLSYEAKVVTLTNTARTQNGCAALKVDARLTTAARAHSADMVQRNYFAHNTPEGTTFVTRVRNAGYPKPTGENIAWGYRTPDAVMSAWLNSPGHRANILNCKSTTIGVGLAKKPDGTPYWTQEFGA